MSLIAQAKLLRVLEERRFERLGGNKSISVDFRLISATNRPLEQFVRDGRFREDLYYRVNAFAIRLPSLRERQVDIPVLAQRFLARYCAAQGLPLDSKSFSREALELLLRYPWPGNIRELESTVSRAALSAPGRAIRAHRYRVPARDTSAPRQSRRSAAVARRRRARAHRARARSGRLEQEGSRARARHQPRHAVPEDRRIPARARRAGRAPEPRRRGVTAGPRESDNVRHMKAPSVAARLYVAAVWSPAWSSAPSSGRTRSPSPALLALLVCSSLASALKVNLPLATSGSTMSVSYAVDFAALLLLGADETMLVAAHERLEPVHVPDAEPRAPSTGRSSAWRRSCSP